MRLPTWMRRKGAAADCREVRAVVQSFLDGELDTARATVVTTHLERCRDCGVEADTLRAVKEAIARQRLPDDPDAHARLVTFARGLVEDAGPG